MDKESFKKYWENPRWHSLIVLIFWILGLGILMGIVTAINSFVSPEEKTIVENKELEEQEEYTYIDKWNDLLNGDYQFIYTIRNENETIKYEGTVSNSVVSGYRERNDGIIKYEIENDIAYTILVEDRIVIDHLYENVNSNFLNLSYLYNVTVNTPENILDAIEENEITSYEYSFLENEEEVKITVIEDVNQIKNIMVQSGNTIYELEYIVGKME